MNRLRRKLMGELNPFSDKYVTPSMNAEIDDLLKSIEDLDFETAALLQSVSASVHLNSFFKEAYSTLEEKILKSQLSKNDIVNFSIASANRHYIMLAKKEIEKYKGISESNMEDAFGMKIDSIDPTIGKIDAHSALEGTIDGLNVLLNYLKYVDLYKRKPDEIKEIEKVDAILSLNHVGSFYYILKHEYDNCIWNNGYLIYDSKRKRYQIDFFKEEELILKQIGFTRLQTNASSYHYLQMKKLSLKNKASKDIFELTLNRTKKRIKNVSIHEGYINFKLGKGVDKDEIFWMTYFTSGISTYYNFLENADLPKFPGISLNDVIILFVTLQHLLQKVVIVEIGNDEIKNTEQFYKFPFRITSLNLKAYLKDTTNYSSKQIKDFINILSNSQEERINFWDHPLISQNNDFVFPLLTICSPLPLYLVDNWMEIGGIDLVHRGRLLEKYLKITLRKELERKKFTFQIPETSKFEKKKSSRKESEEIDLVINLKSCVIVAEVKCIKYPMEARNYYNAFKTLSKGAKQVIKKTNFLEKYKKEFLSTIGNIDDKNIITLVITNYPIFTGFQIENVPIVDYYLLEAYIRSGKLTREGINFKTYETKIMSEEIFYRNEDEFCENFRKHMVSPPAVNELRSLVKVQYNKVTPGSAETQVYVKAANYIET